MNKNNTYKKAKGIFIVLIILYLIYFYLVISWIKHAHSEINIYSISGIFLPLVLFLFISYGLFKTSGLINKKYITINIIIIIFPVLISFGLVLYNEAESKFNYENWIEKQDKRVWMVDDLLEKHEIVGMYRNEIIELLGEPSDTEYFKESDNIVYWLGTERGLVRIDSEWLVIWFDDKDIAIDVKIMRD